MYSTRLRSSSSSSTNIAKKSITSDLNMAGGGDSSETQCSNNDLMEVLRSNQRQIATLTEDVATIKLALGRTNRSFSSLQIQSMRHDCDYGGDYGGDHGGDNALKIYKRSELLPNQVSGSVHFSWCLSSTSSEECRQSLGTSGWQHLLLPILIHGLQGPYFSAKSLCFLYRIKAI